MGAAGFKICLHAQLLNANEALLTSTINYTTSTTDIIPLF